MKIALLFLLTVLAPMAAAQGLPFDYPAEFLVSGVAEDDVLNVRAEPDASSADLGDLSPGARIEVIEPDASGDWGLVRWEEATGRVALEYLERQPTPTLPGHVLPTRFTCHGTEPFWSLRAGEEGPPELQIMDGDKVQFLPASSSRAMNRTTGPVAFILASGGELRATGLMIPERCNDGMSDLAYGLRLWLLVEAGMDGFLLEGCCSLSPN